MTRNDHLFVSSNGALYDTREVGWSQSPPLRLVYSALKRKIRTCEDLKAALRHGGFAWPGGYTCAFVTSDGELLTFDTVREHLETVLWSIRNKADDGWRVIGVTGEYESDGPAYCSHSGELLWGDESFYDQEGSE